MLKVLKEGDAALWARANAIVQDARIALSADFRAALVDFVAAAQKLAAAWPTRGEDFGEHGYPPSLPRPFEKLLGELANWKGAVALSVTGEPPRRLRDRSV